MSGIHINDTRAASCDVTPNRNVTLIKPYCREPGAVGTAAKSDSDGNRTAVWRPCPLRYKAEKSPQIHMVTKLARPVAEPPPTGARAQKSLRGHLGRTHMPALG